MDTLQLLVELEALKRLKATYFYHIDHKNWDEWLALFTPDASLAWDGTVSTLGREGKLAGRHVGHAAIREFVIEKTLNPTVTVHQGHTPILDIISETEARGIWAMEDIVDTKGGLLHGFGHYHETYRKVNGEWKISSLHLKRIRLVITQA